MLKKCILLFVILCLPMSLFAGTVGKIVGVVKDKETGEALPGANVQVLGTNLGAATDVDGNFIILNVPVGTYEIKAGYIGYRDVTISQVRVNIGLTTELDFDLPSEAIALEAISIVAERPLVNKNATNEIHIMNAEQIENLPIRGYANVAALSGGVVQVGGTLFVRGGRQEEVAFYVDGVLQNDVFSSNRAGDISSNSLEQVQVQAGGFNAEYGFANSGLVQVTTKTGGQKIAISGEVLTDEFLAEDEENLGAFSYGYNIYNLALNGPLSIGNLGNKVKFYVTGERQFLGDRRTSSGVHPVSFDSLTNTVLVSEGPLPNNQLSRWNWNGNVTIDLKPLQFKIGGNSTRDEWRSYSQAFSLFNSDNNRRSTRDTDSYYIKATHTIGSNTFWTATASIFRTELESGDNRFFDNLEAAGDTTFNENLRAPGLNPRTDDRQARFAPFGTTITGFNKNKSTNFGLRGDLTHQMGRIHEFKAGFELYRHTIRKYSVSTFRIASARAANPDAADVDIYRSAFASNIGYDIFGQEEIDDGIDRARNPVTLGVYLQDKLEFRDLVLNLGVRLDYLKTDAETIADPSNILITEDGLIDPVQLLSDKTYTHVNPRIGLSFPVTDRTVFHAQYGKFTQQPDLNDLFIAYLDFANNLLAGNFTTSENPELEPVRTTSYEFGFRQQLGDNAALDITAYYKEIRDLVQARNITSTPTTYASFVNGDFGTVKGLSTTFELRRTNRVTAFASYTLQFAGGTGSTDNDAFAINWLGNPPVYPTFVAPLSFDQRHTGSLSLDYRTSASDGPLLAGGHPLGRLGVNLLFTFGSGRPYTPGHQRSAIFGTGPAAQNKPQAGINTAYTPFQTELDLKIDKSFNVGRLDLNVYLWALNVLDANNVRFVYEQNGEPDTDGFLDTAEGRAFAAQTPSAASFYAARVNNPNNFETPRQYRIGLRFNFR